MSNETLLYILLGWMFALSALLFILMGADKKRAQAKRWRVPEKTLFFVALLGGALGGVLGMRAFRHKTKHASFFVGMPLLVLVNIAVALFVLHWNAGL